MNLIIFSLLALLVLTAVMIATLRNLWACIMATGIYSFLGASWMLLLDAPDVAFTEAAVGAGIATVLMLTTLSLTGSQSQSSKAEDEDIDANADSGPISQRAGGGRRLLSFVVVTVTGIALVYGTLDMPHFGDPKAPIQTYPHPSFVERSQPDMHGLPNVVTAVLASYRGYDTFGETTVIFTAGCAVLLILRRRPGMADGAQEKTTGDTDGPSKHSTGGKS